MSDAQEPPQTPQDRAPRSSLAAPPTLGSVLLAVMLVWIAHDVTAPQWHAKGVRHLFSAMELGLATALVVSLAGAAGAWFFVCHRPGVPVRSGMRLHNPGARWLLMAVALGLALGGVAAWTTKLTSPEGLSGHVDGLLGYGMLAAYILLGPIGEEAYYRALILPAFVGRFGANTGLAVLCIGHATLLALFAESVATAFAVAFAVELALSLLWYFSRSLWPSIVANSALTLVFHVAAVGS